jgi:hypothetical protein
MVNVNETTCLVEAVMEGVFAGTSGGGIARWTDEGVLSSITTSAGPMTGLRSNHIVDMARGMGSCFAITGTDEPIVYATGSSGNGWNSIGTVSGAEGPLRTLRGTDDSFVILDSAGTVFVTSTGVGWERPGLPSGIPPSGWDHADRDGDVIALANDTVFVVVDLATDFNLTVPSPPADDIDMAGELLAIASFDAPDVYDLDNGSWMDNKVVNAMAREGDGWNQVRVDPDRLIAATSDGVVVEVDLTPPSTAGDVTVLGSLPAGLDATVTDMLPLANDTVLLSTMKGNWVVTDGEAAPFLSIGLSMPPTNDIRSVAYEADTVWALTPGGISFLTFDGSGLPTRWSEGPYLGEGATLDTLDAALLEGRVYLSGYDPGVHTYDTFASSSESRWDRTHLYGDARDEVLDVAVIEGSLYTGGPYGLNRMLPGSDPPEFEAVPGSPASVLSLYAVDGYELYVGTENGLWSYEPVAGTWKEPGDHVFTLPEGPVSDIMFSGGSLFISVDDTLHWPGPAPSASHTFSPGSDIARLSARFEVDDPVWAVVDGRAYTLEINETTSSHLPESERLEGAWVRDLVMAPDGTTYLATDSGLHRIDRFATRWNEWTTSNGLSANDIRALAMAPGTGDLWVGAYGGVDVMDTATEETTRIGTEDGIPSNLVYDIQMEDGSVWIGTDVGGAARADLQELEWQVHDQSTGLIADDVQAVTVWNDQVLFGTDEGVTMLDRSDSTISSYTSTSSDLPSNWVWCVLATVEGIYVGTDQGLAIFEPDQGLWSEIVIEDNIGGDVRSLEQDTQGRLWAGTNRGVRVLTLDNSHTPLQTISIDRASGLPGEEVLALREASDGSIWIGTSAGVAVVGPNLGIQASFTTLDGLVHDRVTAIEEGQDGTLWLGTAGGLSRLSKEPWDLLPQWSIPVLDIPDVTISLDNVVVVPEEPNEGETVSVSVTVSNPSGKRAIVHVGLFEDDEGNVGEEVSTSIAYTEPGGTYQVPLVWTAMGGDRTLWVVADPDNVVPESNERNNVVAITLHVNHRPEILDLSLGPPMGSGPYPMHIAEVPFNFTYRDLDGEWATQITAQVIGADDLQVIQPRGGDAREGIEINGYVSTTLGDSTIVFTVTDGRTSTNVSATVHANFAIDVTGLERGRDEDGDVRFDLAIVDPWEGNSLKFVEVWFVEPGTDPMDMDVWDGNIFKSATADGEEWLFDASRVDPGEYDVWVLATDNRWFMSLHVEEGIVIDEPSTETEVPGYIWLLGACIIITLVVVIITSIGRRSAR